MSLSKYIDTQKEAMWLKLRLKIVKCIVFSELYYINTSSAHRNSYDFSSKQAFCILTLVLILDLERNCLLTVWLQYWIGITNFV